VSRSEERRRRRAAAQRVLDALALDYVDRADVDRAPMFGSEGLRANARFFAFVGADGQQRRG
jgi:predicted metallopeptidase